MHRTWATSLRDLADDVVVSIARSPLRPLLLGIGGAIAGGVLAFSITSSSTEASRVANRFDELAATRIQIDLPLPGGTYRRLDADQLRALQREPGVVALAWLHQRNLVVTSQTEPHWRLDTDSRLFEAGGDLTVLQVAPSADVQTLGEGVWVGGAAEFARSAPPNAVIELDGEPNLVAGVLRRSALIPEILIGLLRYRAQTTADLERRGQIVLQVKPGWADLVARRIQTHLEPNTPDVVTVNYPPEAVNLRAEIVTRVDSLVLVLTAALLLVSAVTVGLATFARALERRRLIGLLRAIGASRRSMIVGMATEAALIGAVAGGIGALAGIATAIATLGRDGGIVVPWGLILAALGMAFAANGLGAVLPAWAATRTLPIRAIRDL